MKSEFYEFFVTYGGDTANGYAYFYLDSNAMYKDLVPNAKENFVRICYDILSVNTQEYLDSIVRRTNLQDREADLPIIGMTHFTECNPDSGFILPSPSLSWSFKPVINDIQIHECIKMRADNIMKYNRASQINDILLRYGYIKNLSDRDGCKEHRLAYLNKCKDFATTIELISNYKNEYVYVYIPDDRKGWSPIRLLGKVVTRDKNMLTILILSHMDIPLFGTKFIINRESDDCSVETLVKPQDIMDARNNDTEAGIADSDAIMTIQELKNYMKCLHRSKN